MSTSRANQLRFGRFTINLPGRRWQRVVLGIALICGGCLWFLPVLGLWMLPLGVLVLSVDFHPIRRLRRRFDVWRVRRMSGGGPKQPGQRKMRPGD